MLLVGADPELFVQDRTSGKFISAHGMVQGDKKNPFVVDKGAVQVDGMALEFNIDPAKSKEEFVDNLQTVMSTLKGMCPDYDVVAVPTAEFGFEYIASQPDEAKILGCEPDYNAWTGKANPRPNAETSFRTGAGHVHIGWTEGMDIESQSHLEDCELFVKALDSTLYLLSCLWDSDKKRRQLYGALGAYRPKSYGVEYRVLSNAWLESKEKMDIVYDVITAVHSKLVGGKVAFVSDSPRSVGEWEKVLTDSSQPNRRYYTEVVCERLGVRGLKERLYAL